MTPEQDTLLFGFWTGIMAGFVYLWVTMLVNWYFHRDNRALVYVLLLIQLSVICGISAVVRSGLFGMTAYTLISVQRGLWVAVLFTCFEVADIYSAASRRKTPTATRLFCWFTGRTPRHVGRHTNPLEVI